MVQGMQTSRSVGLHPETVIGVAKSHTPMVNLDYGIDWPVTFQINLTELGGPILASWWWHNVLEVPGP